MKKGLWVKSRGKLKSKCRGKLRPWFYKPIRKYRSFKVSARYFTSSGTNIYRSDNYRLQLGQPRNSLATRVVKQIVPVIRANNKAVICAIIERLPLPEGVAKHIGTFLLDETLVHFIMETKEKTNTGRNKGEVCEYKVTSRQLSTPRLVNFKANGRPIQITKKRRRPTVILVRKRSASGVRKRSASDAGFVECERIHKRSAPVPGATVPGAPVPGATVPGAPDAGATVHDDKVTKSWYKYVVQACRTFYDAL
jgi:hypothetical protein